jgi:hypothetical protein
MHAHKPPSFNIAALCVTICQHAAAFGTMWEGCSLARVTVNALQTLLLAAVTAMLFSLQGPAAAASQSKPLSGDALLQEVQHRAFKFFWEKSDPNTGLTNDRARNIGGEDHYTIASTASTGYALASLPVAVTHHWIGQTEAYDRALSTLRFVNTRLPNVHGWYYHFIDKHTGERAWNCELSSVDTCLLLLGALSAGEYWKGTEVQKLANTLYDRVDWSWMRTDGGTRPEKLTLSMGWKPESGFLSANWDRYCELMLIYILAMGSKTDPQPAACWSAWQRNVVTYGPYTTLAGGPIFMHQMSHIYYNFKDLRDGAGWNYFVSSQIATQMNRQFCLDHPRKSYSSNIWGLNACDGPDGYTAYGVPDKEDGTVSTTGAIASILFTPQLARASADETYRTFADKIWGRYGFSNSFNVDRSWYDADVIGIDLGMALLAIEDAATGLPWKLLASHPSTASALKKAGFHTTREKQPGKLQRYN